VNISIQILFAFLIFQTSGLTGKQGSEKIDIQQLWLDCKLEKEIPFEIFSLAVSGNQQLDNLNKNNIISIIDYSKPSTDKRFYVIDLHDKKLIYKCLVAHGRNSGENTADNFSNEQESLKSSLGFYITKETYTGKNGYSLRLDGLEKGINDNALIREIVIHGADYVSEEFIKKNGRLGRSWGCPALPTGLSKEIIDKISNGSCLFIFADDKFYKENSIFFNRKQDSSATR
jgi:hypothetical protein